MIARMNEATWLAGLPRARATEKHRYVAIHVAAELRDSGGVAPVVLQTEEGYTRAPAMMEAAFELCLRHLHGQVTPLTCQSITAQALLANRAVEALRLPGRYVPTSKGDVIDMQAPMEAGAPTTCERPAAYADKEGDEAGDAPEVEAPDCEGIEAATRGISNAEPRHAVNEMDTPCDAPEVEATTPGDAPEVEESKGSEGLEADAQGISKAVQGHAVNEMDTSGDASELEAVAPGDTPEVDEADASEHQTTEAAAEPPRAEASTWRVKRRAKRAERRRAKKRRG